MPLYISWTEWSFSVPGCIKHLKSICTKGCWTKASKVMKDLRVKDKDELSLLQSHFPQANWIELHLFEVFIIFSLNKSGQSNVSFFLIHE